MHNIILNTQKIISNVLEHFLQNESTNSNIQKIFIEKFYSYVSEGDISQIDIEILSKSALDVLEFMDSRTDYSPKIKVYNPTYNNDIENEVNNTEIYMINNDKPFIIDSIIETLNRYNLNIKLLIHPIFAVERDKNGKLINLYKDLSDNDSFTQESVVQITLDRRISENKIKKI